MYTIQVTTYKYKYKTEYYDYEENLILKERQAWSSSVWKVVSSSSVGYLTGRSLDLHKQSTSKLAQQISVKTRFSY